MNVKMFEDVSCNVAKMITRENLSGSALKMLQEQKIKRIWWTQASQDTQPM